MWVPQDNGMACVLVRVLQRRRSNRLFYAGEEIYFKEFAHAVVGANKFKICRASQLAGEPGKN